MAVLNLYLGEGGRAAVLSGEPRITTHLKAAVEARGWKVQLRAVEERPLIPFRPGYHMVQNDEVPSDRCLTLRRVGWEPFWRIERTNDRWDWEIAAQIFDPETIDPARAERFMAHWQGRLFGEAPVRAGGGVLVALQGRLLAQRHFQSASPLEMLRRVAARWPDRPVSAHLHPRETYHPEEERALADLQAELPNIRIEQGTTTEALLGCDLVVTENSSVALRAYVARKPVMLWARIDFHHIAASVPQLGQEPAFARLEDGSQAPDFARYLYWYFRENCLRSWNEGIAEAIWQRLRKLGWPI